MGHLSLLLTLVLLVGGCDKQAQPVYQGYAEGEFVLVAAPLAGQLTTLDVRRGDQIKAGVPLFALDAEPEQAALAAAEQLVQRALSRLEDLKKGERPSETEALRARREQARAALELSSREAQRRRQLFTERVISGEELDRAEAAFKRDRAAVAQLQAELDTARLGSRSDVVTGAAAELEAARASLEVAHWALKQKHQVAPADALVFDNLFEPGEFVPTGIPVVSLLPSGNIKLRFFVPEPLVGSLQIGQKLAVTFDGSDGPLTAVISFISPQVEYTPPVIYSRDTRTKLVFRVEAHPDQAIAGRFHPGQPIDVRLEDPHD